MSALSKVIYPNKTPFTALDDHLNAPVPPAPPGPTYREVFVGVMDATNTVPQHTQTEATHAVMPHVDTGTGVVAFNAPNVPNEALFNPQVYITKTITATSMPIVGTGHRGLWAVVEMNPPADSTVRAWGVNASAEITLGNPRNFAAPYGGDLLGVEGAGRHAGTGTVGLAIGSSGYVMCSNTGRIDQAVAMYARSPRVDGAPGSVGRIVRCEGLRVHYEIHVPGAVVDFQYGFIVEDLCGPCGIGYENPVAKLAVNGGIHAGGESDPGPGRIQGAFVSSDGTLGVSGTFLSADVPAKTITVKDGIIVSIV